MDLPSKAWAPRNIGQPRDSGCRLAVHSNAVNVRAMTTESGRGSAGRIRTTLALKLIYSVVLQLVLFGLLLFVPARTLTWPRAWV